MYRLVVSVIMGLKRRFKSMGEFIREEIHPLKAQLHLQFFSGDTNKDGLSCNSSCFLNFHCCFFAMNEFSSAAKPGFQHNKCKCVLFYDFYRVLPDINS